MSIQGTILNGQVKLDGPANLPDGTRVTLWPDETFEYPHPMAPYDSDKELALLRESYAEIMAGKRGMPLDQFEAELTKEFESLPNRPE